MVCAVLDRVAGCLEKSTTSSCASCTFLVYHWQCVATYSNFDCTSIVPALWSIGCLPCVFDLLSLLLTVIDK